MYKACEQSLTQRTHRISISCCYRDDDGGDGGTNGDASSDDADDSDIDDEDEAVDDIDDRSFLQTCIPSPWAPA